MMTPILLALWGGIAIRAASAGPQGVGAQTAGSAPGGAEEVMLQAGFPWWVLGVGLLSGAIGGSIGWFLRGRQFEAPSLPGPARDMTGPSPALSAGVPGGPASDPSQPDTLGPGEPGGARAAEAPRLTGTGTGTDASGPGGPRASAVPPGNAASAPRPPRPVSLPPVDSEDTYMHQPMAAARSSGSGPYAPVLAALDRAIQVFQLSLAEAQQADSSLAERFPDLGGDIDQLDYQFNLLFHLSEYGSTVYTTALDDHIEVGSFEQWLDLFAAVLLDPMSSRCSDLLLSGLDGDVQARLIGEILRDMLQYPLPEALRLAGYEAIPAFPLCGCELQSGTMRVIGTTRRAGLDNQVITVRQYGLIKGRVVVRQAHVTTG